MAEFYAGYLYSTGSSAIQNKTRAKYYYEKAGAKGIESAKYNLSKILLDEAKNKNDIQAAFDLNREAANAGYPGAQFQLGVFYQFGMNVKPDPFEALKWYERAAENGHASAMFNIGVLYCKNGPRIMQNKEKCIEAYAKSAAMGYGKAAYNLAVLYSEPLDGYVSVPDFEKSHYWALEAARLGEPFGMLHLYNEWKIHQLPSMPKKQALIWLRAAALNGNAPAQSELGELYAKGEIIRKDKQMAANWMIQAHMQGEKRADNTLMNLYFKEGYREDFQYVVEALRFRGKNGDTESLNLLALMYLRASGVERSVEEAASLYRLAGLMGDTNALQTVAQMYTNGTDGLRKQPDIGRQLYFNLVERGDKSAQYYLGSIYERGKGVPVDKARAYMWYSLAGKNMVGAIRQKEALKEELPRKVIARAERQARICRLTRYKDRACQVT